MKRLTAHLGGPRLWVKREDATGLGFGGNKFRKLDYVLHEALSPRRRYDRLRRRRAIEQPAAGSGGGGEARDSRAILLYGQTPTTDAGIQDLGQRTSQPAVRRAPTTTCHGPATAMRPFACSLPISKRRVTSPTSCHTECRMPWARSVMPRRLPRSNRRQRDWASHRALSCTAPEAPARQAGLIAGAAVGNAKYRDCRD